MVSSSQNSKIVRQLLTDKRLSIVTAAQLTVAYFKQQKHQQQDLGALEKLAVEKQKKQDRENLKQLQAYPDGRVWTDPWDHLLLQSTHLLPTTTHRDGTLTHLRIFSLTFLFFEKSEPSSIT